VSSEYEDPIDALAELFAEADPQPTPGFVDRLDTELRIAHAERARSAAPNPRWGRLGALASVAVIVLAVATVGLVWNDRSVSSALEMTDAIGVQVTLPDGSTIEDPADGFDLPEGAIIVVRVGGSVTIDDVSLGEGATVTVRDGALVADVEVTTSTSRTVMPPEPVERGGSTDGIQSVPGAEATPEPPTSHSPLRPGDDPNRPARPADRPGDQPIPEPPRPSDGSILPGRDSIRPAPQPNPQKGGPTVTIEPRPLVPPVTIDPPPLVPPVNPPMPSTEVGLSVRRHGRTHKVTLRWSTGPAIDARWRSLLIRSSADAPPDWPLGPGMVVLGEAPAGSPGEAVDDVPADMTAASYRVVLLDSAGGVVARGVVQRVMLG